MAAKSERKSRKRFKSQFRIYFEEEIALGPGKSDLLRHISETGSISEAARRMDMSYNRAWLLVRTMNRCFKEPLVLASRGGDARGGAELTKTGQQVLALYQQLDAKVKSATRHPLKRLFSYLKN
ncbi:MAG TPA: LysR family transcriptional regulator [Verrucomicrobiae bacterium]|jgi:molybdate transport system regulatory protein|nr:LysR family transcriptional regulator [Verrucomicrobiae bacterium]